MYNKAKGMALVSFSLILFAIKCFIFILVLWLLEAEMFITPQDVRPLDSPVTFRFNRDVQTPPQTC